VFVGEPFYLVLLSHCQEGMESNDQQPTVEGHRRFNPGKLTVQRITEHHLFIMNGQALLCKYITLGILWVCSPTGLVCPVLESGTAVCLKCSGKTVEGQSGTLLGHCSSCCVTVHCEHFFCLGIGRVLCAITAACVRHWHAGLSPHTMTLY